MERMKMSKAQFVQFLVNEVSGSQMVGVTTRIPVEMRKGRSKANRNPYYGRVERVKTRSLFFGWLDYERTINNRLERKECESDFKTQPMSGRKWLHYGKVERNKYDESRLYIRFYTKLNNPFTEVYLVDGAPATAEQIAVFQAAQGELTQALGKLMAISESYPDLKASQNFSALQSQLEGTENRITVARNNFNEVARQFNTLIRRFPTNLIANAMNAEKRAYFEATDGAEQAPKVQF